jgi:phosphatidate cytidylyltransferase
VFLLAVAALAEYFFMVFRRLPKQRAVGILLGALLCLGLVIPGLSAPGLWLSVVMLAGFSFYLFSAGELEEKYRHLGWTLLGVLYLGFLFPHVALLYQFAEGRAWVFFLLLVIMSGDTAGYFVGRRWGRNRLYPEVSPGKTVEGALASLVASLAAGWIGGKFLLPRISGAEALLLSLSLSLLGQAGDLFESWIKRVFSVKDSGALLPGHGGLLDRMDSLIFPGVLMTYYVRFFHS